MTLPDRLAYSLEHLGKTRLRAKQVSRRSGDLLLELVGDRVRIAGRAVMYLEGTISLDGIGA